MTSKFVERDREISQHTDAKLIQIPTFQWKGSPRDKSSYRAARRNAFFKRENKPMPIDI